MFEEQQFTLMVRGKEAYTGNHDDCMTALLLRYGWVPMKHNHLLKIEMVPVNKKVKA